MAGLAVIGVSPLIVAHVNHLLRGAESDADAKFVEGLAAQFSLPYCTELAPVSALANIEQAARHVRYEKLRMIAQVHNIMTIATAHTLHDQAETVMMRILRGTGLAGLGGIPPIRLWHGIRIIRPLLNVRRDVMMDFLNTAQLSYRADSSNTDLRFTRNRVRHKLMPALAEVAHPNLIERLGRLSREARRLHRRIVGQARQDIQDCELARAGAWTVFDAGKLSKLLSSRVRELWRHIWRREHWPTGEMTRRHWQRLAELAHGEGIAIDCPGGIRVRRVGHIVRAGPEA
jgi:tRNA(Ile)-lysidine synthase